MKSSKEWRIWWIRKSKAKSREIPMFHTMWIKNTWLNERYQADKETTHCRATEAETIQSVETIHTALSKWISTKWKGQKFSKSRETAAKKGTESWVTRSEFWAETRATIIYPPLSWERTTQRKCFRQVTSSPIPTATTCSGPLQDTNDFC